MELPETKEPETEIKPMESFKELKDESNNEMYETKLNKREKFLKAENERLKREVLVLKEDYDQIRTKYEDTDVLKKVAEYHYENEKKKNENLQDLYGKWIDIDLTEHFKDDVVDEEWIKKYLHYNTVQINIDKENIKTLKNTINSLEYRLRLKETLPNPTTNFVTTFFDQLFGRNVLKMEIQRLTSENQNISFKQEEIMGRIKGMSNIKDILEEEYRILKEREENVTKLLKDHKLEVDRLSKRVNDMEEENQVLRESNITQQNRIKEIEASWRNEPETTIEVRNEVNCQSLEYDQLGRKLHDAIDTKLQFDHMNLYQNVLDRDFNNDQLPSKEDVINPSTEIINVSSTMSQLINQEIEVANCPCCDQSKLTSDLEAHLENCLLEQN